eukprot:CAMPEP_0197414410 /NCGR_PEP_ID=MMETSP1170-20131217/1125_1 /TAXON_ID=54406 /ORGANISM="Sarcinochrysis sp, Strain CCMP770" /LENGTH=55 /DNA_ID=CAMNT_0042941119 /DNA_START=18 /DNA_END=182 /DNA_ORIENTATION=-
MAWSPSRHRANVVATDAMAMSKEQTVIVPLSASISNRRRTSFAATKQVLSLDRHA